MHIDINRVNEVFAKNIHDLQCMFAQQEWGNDDERGFMLGETPSIEELISVMAPVLMADEPGNENLFENKLRAFDCAIQMIIHHFENTDNPHLDFVIRVENEDDMNDMYTESMEDEEEDNHHNEMDPKRFAQYIFDNYTEQLKIFTTLSSALQPNAKLKSGHKM